MEVVKKVEPAEVKKLSTEEHLEKLFDSLITKNYITKEIKVGNLTLVLKPLSSGELLEADTIYIASVSSIPNDVVSRARMVSTLSYAIESVNGHKITSEDKEEERSLKNKLYNLLMKLPPSVLDNIYSEYMELVNQQNDLFKDVGENIENF